MNEMTTFEFEGNGVRVIRDENGDPWWVAKDVCDVLGLLNPSMAIEAIDDDERAKKNLGRQGETWTINEPGLYTLIIRSNKPEAKKFKRWITHEVLPSIRKTGCYSLSGLDVRRDMLLGRVGRGKLTAHEHIQYLKIADRLAVMDDEHFYAMIDIYDLISTPMAPGETIGDHDIIEVVSAFVADMCIVHSQSWVGASTIYEAFCEWLSHTEYKVRLKQKKFGMIMRMRFEAEKVGGLYRYWGVRLAQSKPNLNIVRQ